MAVREIRKIGDPILRKVSKPVKNFDEKLHILLDDMHDTLDECEGVGLAAPQVGVLKRIAVIDVGDGLIELINPEIVSTEGTQNDLEGCRSLPGKWGYVERPKKVTVRAMDRTGDVYEYEGEDLLARAFCHELEHLDGILFSSHVTEFVEPDR